MSRLLLIAPYASYKTTAFQLAAKRLGIDLIVASEGTCVLLPTPSAGLSIDFCNLNASIKKIIDIYHKEPFEGVIATDDISIELSSKIAEIFQFPKNSSESAKVIKRKDLARTFQKDAGLRTPWFISVDLSDSTILHEIPKIPFPCVAKPVALSASRGVIRCNDFSELSQALVRIRNIVESEHSHHPKVCLIEEYIPGVEFAIEGILNQGRWTTIALFRKPDPLEGPFFEETIYVSPAELEPTIEKKLIDTMKETCKAYGFKHGPIHAEFRVNHDEIWLIELAARTIGGKCGRIIEWSTGRALEEIVILNALGRPIPEPHSDVPVGVMMIPVPKSGTLRRVDGIEAARKIDYIDSVEIDIKAGQNLTVWPEGGMYPGFIFSKGPNIRSVIDALRQSHSKLKFVIGAPIPTLLGAKLL